MNAETFVQAENVLPENTRSTPGVPGKDVQPVASSSQMPPAAPQAEGTTDTARGIPDQSPVTEPPSPETQPTQVSVDFGRGSIGDDDGYSARLLDTLADVEKDGIIDDDGYSLRILEMPLNGESPANCVAECHSEAQAEAVLAGLGPMDSKSARIYWSVPARDENRQGSQTLHEHIQRMLGHEVQKAPDALDSSKDFRAMNNPIRLRALWDGSARPFIMELCQVEESQPETSFPYSPAYRLRKFQAHIRCIEFEEDKLVVVAVLCQSYLQSSSGQHVNLRTWNHLVSDMHSQTNSIFKFLDGTGALFIKLLLLDFLNAGLNWLHDRIADVKCARLELARRTNNDTKLGESANSDLSKTAVEWPKRAVVIGEVLVIMCHDLADSANYMIRHLQCEVGQQAEMPCQAPANSTIEITQAWKHVSLDISLSCEEVKKQSTQIFNSERGRYGMYNTQIGARASQSATRLTILAGTFLPASLASGILSMQGRVRDIGVKFFDFFRPRALY
ncbi:hypothetical protein MGU_01820 [Metarhizium guizhouense ARSEF 977]|uniref:Uncharacterized protein n=1 Tax=Metarhizium guizhouense (strain ARSEF 977) TaxID=1276136 RepID=A0A0B4HLM9_METGA|nr:hypothetical protein MGU_01820 [Metarhizium guizhouense ARSEF 977]